MCLGAAVLLSANIVLAESKKTAVTTDEFVEHAATAGAAEVELSKLALKKSQNSAVRDFAQKMVTDHTKAAGELRMVATKENIKVPAAPDATLAATIDKLSKEQGAAFDRAFATRMLQDHQEAVTLFEKAASQSDINPAIRQFASTTLPTLRGHLDHAKELNTAVGADSRQSLR
jgi:putative membrane protein